jgi:hypothetical protein
MMVADSTSDRSKLPYGMVDSHAYSVEGVVSKNGKDYIQVRNPWGDTEVGSDGKNDGRFLIAPEDFKKWFTFVEHDAPVSDVEDDFDPRHHRRIYA